MTDSPTPGLNSVIIVVKNPLDAFHITFGLLSKELTKKGEIKQRIVSITPT